MDDKVKKKVFKPSASAYKQVPKNDGQYITKERIQELLPKKTSIKVTDEIITLISNMEKDTGLPQELLEEDFFSYLHLLGKGRRNSIEELINAIKFCNLRRNYNNKESWSIVFPDKYRELVEANKQVDSFVSMYANSKLVVAVDKEMLIPVHLQYAPYFHAAVKKQYELMQGVTDTKDRHGNNDRVSPMVQHLAAKELANLTRQPEESKLDISIKPSDAAISAQSEMNEQLKQLVAMQRKQLEEGEDIIDVQQIGIDFSSVGRESDE
jgi:hypothetical protein